MNHNYKNIYIVNMGKDFPSILAEYKRKIQDSENLFLNDQLFKVGDDRSIERKLYHIHSQLKLYTNESVIVKLKKDYNIDDNLSKWFISLDEIIEHFNLITKVGILINGKDAIEMIKSHLMIKFRTQRAITFKHGKEEMGLYSVDALTKWRRIANYQSNLSPSDRKKMKLEGASGKHWSQYTPLEIAFWNSERITQDIKYAKGDTIMPLRLLAFDCLYYDSNKISQGKFFRTLYGLFKLILKDMTLPENEEEFILQYNYSSKRFPSFQAHFIKKLLMRR